MLCIIDENVKWSLNLFVIENITLHFVKLFLLKIFHNFILKLVLLISFRCGGVYCSTHRYAETHSCTFNYKAEGRKCLARNNPLVTATKLPKI